VASSCKCPTRITIDERHCKGCGLCVEFCPRGVLAISTRLSASGVNPATIVNEEECTGCANCVAMCPDAAIELAR